VITAALDIAKSVFHVHGAAIRFKRSFRVPCRSGIALPARAVAAVSWKWHDPNQFLG
jgi:hypothetical protein